MMSLVWRDTKKNVEQIAENAPCGYAIDYMPEGKFDTAYISTDKVNVDYEVKISATSIKCLLSTFNPCSLSVFSASIAGTDTAERK